LFVGLGTDGAASNNDLNMWEEMDTVAKLHKVFSGDPKVISAQEAFELATIRGAQALHLEKEIGSLEKGKARRSAVIDRDTLNQIPLYNIYSDLVYATKASDVETVIINGRVVMRNRRLLTLNEATIKTDARAFRDNQDHQGASAIMVQSSSQIDTNSKASMFRIQWLAFVFQESAI
jgi:5-methylthioadenosine/S-adenosylhomocysteine deaminase